MSDILTPEQRTEAAGEFTQALAEAVKPMSLNRILHTLDDLVYMLETAESDEERAAITAELERYASDEVLAKKADGIGAAILRWKAIAAENRSEGERRLKRAAAFEARIENLKERTQFAMESHGISRIETEGHTLALRGNGGVQPLELHDIVAVPKEYTTQTVTLPSGMWEEIGVWLGRTNGGLKLWHQLYDALGVPLPDNEALRKALGVRVTCPECKGGGLEGERVECQRCEGKGTIPATIDGVRLLPRGKHLRVS